MDVEERMYRLKVGSAPEYFRNYQEFGMQCAPFFVERLKKMLAAVK